MPIAPLSTVLPPEAPADSQLYARCESAEADVGPRSGGLRSGSVAIAPE
jgi:hypothetical protein